ncbi:MAG: O-acetyl-ADP-ribose deacetylase [Xanthomonadaceae bacterium]|nr:O-acetyl-ADP-ribose deacetylase [Xanthomonadaceae bacterium]
MPIELIQGDITGLRLDAIVNAANAALSGGGGVDGAIHRAAGPALSAACKAIPMVRPFVRCPTGEARITPGFDLPARWIIHVVGPVWSGGREGEPELLASCHRNALALAQAHGIASIAFPAISCGVFGYPPDQAVDIAVRIVRAHAPDGMRVVFCMFDAAMAERYRRALE